MEDKTKKPSLFKQRIAAFKKNTNTVGFPQAVNILGPEPFKGVSCHSQETTLNSQQQKQQKNLLDDIKSQSLLKEDDIKKIQQENWAKIEAMSEEQRQNMIKFINSEMNEGFINKLRKRSVNKEAIQTSPEPQKVEQKPKQKEEPEQNADSWQLSLKLNIETDKLCYSEQNEENLVGIARMIEMVGSENNQSQIIGSKLVAKFVDLLTASATSKSRQLILVSYVPLHLSIIFEKCSYLLIEPMIKKARNTTFRSAFVEITTRVAEILTKAHQYLSKPHKELLSKQLKALIDKCKSFKIDKESMETLRSSLDIVCSALDHFQNKVQNADWGSLKEYGEIMLQIILLEQSDATYFNTYAASTLQFVEKSSDLAEIVDVERFVYEIVNQLVLRRNKELYLNLQTFRNIWRPVIDVISVKLLSKIASIELQITFELVFLARFAGDITWERIIATVQQLSLIKSMVPHFILFNTLSDQKSAGLREQNLQSLNMVFSWLSNALSKSPCKLNPNFIINTLIELFLQEEQYYSQLDQAILQRLLTQIAINPSTNFAATFTQEKIRTLITNYGFNSFGNQVFTNLLLFIAIKVSPDLQALILRELAVRYTSNFIGSATRLSVDLTAIQGKRVPTNQQIKAQILQSIKSSNPQHNLFLDYLNS